MSRRLVAGSPALSLDVDLESAGLLGLFRYGLWRGVEAQVGVPLIVDQGGFLDGPIEEFEHLVGATPMPGRQGRPRGLAASGSPVPTAAASGATGPRRDWETSGRA